MNIHHLKYFIALAKRSNYREAAEFCNVSQPAMSMAIKSFEEKLGEKLFIRQKSPIELSHFGQRILPYAEKIVHEFDMMMGLNEMDSNDVSGTLRLGIIPTVSPYLIPNFIGSFIEQYPDLTLEIEDLTTKNVIHKINNDEIDAGIIATPVDGMSLCAKPMYYEEFMVYSAQPSEKRYILPADIELDKIWLLQEGHCLRSQVMNLCELKSHKESGIHYNAGSIETLINLVDSCGGVTVIPELSISSLSKSKKEKLSLFEQPAPVREISMVYHKYSVKLRAIEALTALITENVPKYMREKEVYSNIKIDLD